MNILHVIKKLYFILLLFNFFKIYVNPSLLIVLYMHKSIFLSLMIVDTIYYVSMSNDSPAGAFSKNIGDFYRLL